MGIFQGGWRTGASGFACRGGTVGSHTCARHYTPGQPVLARNSSFNDDANTIQLVSWDGPCQGQGIGPGVNDCEFLSPSVDTCVTVEFRKLPGSLGDPVPIEGLPCPTGIVTE